MVKSQCKKKKDKKWIGQILRVVTVNFIIQELRHELERCEPRIISLEEAARQVLTHQQEDNTSANLCQQRLTTLRLRLQSLSRLTVLYMGRLAGGAQASERIPSLDTLSQQV